MKTKYHGWIFREKALGFKDSFAVRGNTSESITLQMGPGEKGAALAVDYFETTLGLGPVKLLSTPLGLRVYTEEPEEEKPVEQTYESFIGWWGVKLVTMPSWLVEYSDDVEDIAAAAFKAGYAMKEGK